MRNLPPSTSQLLLLPLAVGVRALLGSRDGEGCVINLTGVGPSVQGFFAIWASGTAYSGTSTLNLNAGEPALANGAIVSLGTGTPDLSVVFGTAVTGTSHLVVDVVGYLQ